MANELTGFIKSKPVLAFKFRRNSTSGLVQVSARVLPFCDCALDALEGVCAKDWRGVTGKVDDVEGFTILNRFPSADAELQRCTAMRGAISKKVINCLKGGAMDMRLRLHDMEYARDWLLDVALSRGKVHSEALVWDINLSRFRWRNWVRLFRDHTLVLWSRLEHLVEWCAHLAMLRQYHTGPCPERGPTPKSQMASAPAGPSRASWSGPTANCPHML